MGCAVRLWRSGRAGKVGEGDEEVGREGGADYDLAFVPVAVACGL